MVDAVFFLSGEGGEVVIDAEGAARLFEGWASGLKFVVLVP